MAQYNVPTVYINKDWTNQQSITEATNPFDVDLTWDSNAFADPPFPTTTESPDVWHTGWVGFVALGSNYVYKTLDIDKVHTGSTHGADLQLFTAAYKGSTISTAYIYSLDNYDKLLISPGSKFTFGSVKNESGDTITIRGAGTVFKVASGIIGSGGTSNGEFFNDGTLKVENGAYFEADTIENDVGGHTVSVTGSNTVFKVDSVFDNHGTLTVGTGAYFEVASFTNQESHVVEISGSSTFFKVKGLYDGLGTLSITDRAKFEAGSFKNEESRNLIISDSEFTVTGEFANYGTVTISGSTVKAGSITSDWSRSINLDADSLIIAGTITLKSNSYINDVLSDSDSFAYKVLSLTSPINYSQNIRAVTSDGTPIVGSTIHTIEVKDGTQTIGYEYWVSNIPTLPAAITKNKVYVNSTWNNEEPGTPLGNDRYYGINAFDKVADAVNEAPLPIFVVGGTYDATNNAPTFNGIATTIQAGTFETSVCGGKVFDAGGEVNGDINFSIAGGTFNKVLFAGDRVNGGSEQTRTGSLSTTVSGGVFNSALAGAMFITVPNPSTLAGSVSLTITGGSLNSWIYGGSLASQKILGENATITGDVTVKIDSSSTGITFANLVAGSYGAGTIKGNAKLVLTGTNAITATGEIWGGCSSDIIRTAKISGTGNRKVDSTVDGDRILSFNGFKNELTVQTNRIRAFSDIKLEGNSTVTLNNYGSGRVTLADVENWTFEKDSSLTGDFINDFNGDTLNLTGFSGTGTFDLMSDSDTSNTNDIFKGFEALGEIQLNGVTQTKTYSSTDTTMTWAFDGGSVVVNKTTGTMSFIA